MVETMKQIIGYKGKLTFDTAKPDGAPRKSIDVIRLENMGWKYKVSIEEGIVKTCSCYMQSLLSDRS